MAALQDETRRLGSSEAIAWRNSLPALAEVLDHPSLQAFHVQVGRSHDLAIEYRLPASTSWVDAILLGRGATRPTVVAIELKDWKTEGDRPGSRESLIQHFGRETLHPSDQVRGYVEYCRRFHSVVQDEDADVSGCVFFTFASNAEAYAAAPHDALVREFPVFARNEDDLVRRFPEHLSERLLHPDPEFARRFSHGTYQQDRGFVRQIAATIARPESSPFVLLDGQRVGFEVCMKHVESVLKPAKATAKPTRRKSVVIIEGPPGSGKSAIAAHLWARIAADEFIDGNVVLTTTSGAQRSNWTGLFESVSGAKASRGVVIGANGYNPGLSPLWVNAEREQGRPTTVSDWRANVARYVSQVPRLRCPDDAFAVSIVDEAHALIDPSVPGKEGVSPSGWAMHAGPQAWHVIRSSRVSVFLMDGQQSYRDNETTTRESIEAFAREFGVEDVEVVVLKDAQFRCGGSAEYVTWLEKVLGLSTASAPASTWRKGQGGPFTFEIVERPDDLDARLREHAGQGATVRLLASYARPWKTKGSSRPHQEPAEGKDFQLAFERDGEPSTWSRIWNYAPDQDYTLFVQAPPGSYMADDPLGEVGCPYVVRGFDFDFIGLLWLSDLVWRKDRWRVQLAHVHESAWKKSIAAARRERGEGPSTVELLNRLARGYRILLSRAMRGAYVWFEDEETRRHVERLLAADRC
ncbi:MAG TPA: DNA/RNA helicase domain-containing protein [Planctomycetota bacterium]|nr:DNA/RNA helicase domain-containing protein [Planctomycetota bacterium]